jgi:23S rRNA pseudouridine1911/1915/1917 synthase
VTTKYELICERTDLPRLDVFLTGEISELTRSRIQKLIDDGYVLVNDIPAFKTGIKLEMGSRVHVEIPEPQQTELSGEDIPLDILFENDDVIVINKPAGMVVHPSAGHSTGTLVNAAIGYSPEMEGIAGEGRPGVVHRLDKDTSGIILLAKNDQSMAWLQQQFKDRTIEKYYFALVDRRPPTPEGRVEAPIGRDPGSRQKMAVVTDAKGREAISIYKTLRNYKNHTLLEVHPLTGRTHQIRVHLAFLGCPVAGDTTYGFKRSSIGGSRHFLHATRLTIHLPGEKQARTFESPLPAELEAVLSKLPLPGGNS